MTIESDLRDAITGGGDTTITFGQTLKAASPGTQDVYLQQVDPSTVHVDKIPSSGVPLGAEAATILWLPWRQGGLTTLQPSSVRRAPVGRLFMTADLTGCKVLAFEGGPTFHIDALVGPDEFWTEVLQDEWIQEHFLDGTPQQVSYVHRAGQAPALWDLAGRMNGGATTTYGAGNVGLGQVAGVVAQGGQERVLQLYLKASPWTALPLGRATITWPSPPGLSTNDLALMGWTVDYSPPGTATYPKASGYPRLELTLAAATTGPARTVLSSLVYVVGSTTRLTLFDRGGGVSWDGEALAKVSSNIDSRAAALAPFARL